MITQTTERHAHNFKTQLGPRTKDLSKEGPFGYWTVLRFDGKRGNYAYWLCRCACGVEKSIKGASLTSGRSTKCSKHCPAVFVPFDETGNVFGLLTVRESAGRNKAGDSLWLCDCECGNTTIVARGDLYKKKGPTRSCGCAKKTQGGGHGTPEYVSWKEMKRRCYNPNAPYYHLYGGRGIYVCERWLEDFQAFLADMGKKPFPNASIERIDNDGIYEPGNCKWDSAFNQAQNTRKVRKIDFDGEMVSLREAARRLRITHRTLSVRIDRHGVEKALSMSKNESCVPHKNRPQ